MVTPALARSALALAVPLALSVAAYARVLDAEFLFDDGHTIVRQLGVKDLGGLVGERLAQGFAGGARPVTELTFALNYAFGRLEPRNFHLANLAIHLAVVVLAWAFTRATLRLAGAPRGEWGAVVVAGIFALHPLQSAAVSYLSQRSELLASGLYLATLLLIVAAEHRGLNRRGAPLFACALATFFLALGAKPIAVTLPAAWLLLVTVVPAPERRAALLSWRARALVMLPFAALDLLFASRSLSSLGGRSNAGFDLPGLSPSTYLLTELRVVVVYLRLLVWPAGQNVDWDFLPSFDPTEPRVVLSGLLLLTLAAGAVAVARAARRRDTEGGSAARMGAFGVLWFFLLLSVTSSIVPLGDVLMEHRVYLASWGVFVTAVVLVDRLLARLGQSRVATAGVVVVALWVVLAVALHRRNAVWESELALWSDAAEKSPAKARPHMSLGFTLSKLKRHDEAIAVLRRALELARGGPAEETLILRNLAAALLWSKRNGEAAGVLERAAAMSPDDPGILVNLAVAARAMKDLPRARAIAQRIVELDPSQGDAWNVLGTVQLEEGDLAGARASLERAVALDPDVGVRSYNLGRARQGQGDAAGACAAWRSALDARVEPSIRTELLLLRERGGCGP